MTFCTYAGSSWILESVQMASWAPSTCRSELLPFSEACEGSDTELWLVRVPADFDAASLDGKDLKFALRGGQRRATLEAPASIHSATSTEFEVTDGAPFEYAPLMTMFPVPGADASGEPSFKRGRPITRMLRISRATAAANVAAISTSAETLPPLRRTRRGRGGLSCNVSMAGLRPRNALPGNGAPRPAVASARPEKRKRAADAQPVQQKETKRLKKKKEKKDRKRAAGAAADEGDAAPSKKKKKKKKKST